MSVRPMSRSAPSASAYGRPVTSGASGWVTAAPSRDGQGVPSGTTAKSMVVPRAASVPAAGDWKQTDQLPSTRWAASSSVASCDMESKPASRAVSPAVARFSPAKSGTAVRVTGSAASVGVESARSSSFSSFASSEGVNTRSANQRPETTVAMIFFRCGQSQSQTMTMPAGGKTISSVMTTAGCCHLGLGGRGSGGGGGRYGGCTAVVCPSARAGFGPRTLYDGR